MEKILVFGGTQFIGRNLVNELVSSDRYEITLYNRGISQPKLFPHLNRITGNRNESDLAILAKEDWDYVIDVSCYFPHSIKGILQHLPKSVKRYILISTCSVYDHNAYHDLFRNEDAPVLSCTAAQGRDESNATYGNRKAECERILINSGRPYTILRPALVFGPYDTTDRMYYWLNQVKKQDRILVPMKGKMLFSATYVRDLVKSIRVSMNPDIESSIYNVISIPDISIIKIVKQAGIILNRKPKVKSAGVKFLQKQDIEPWFDLPLWIKHNENTYNNAKMVQHLDFELTPFEEAMKSTILYYESLKWPEPTFGIRTEKANQLLALLDAS